MWMSLPPIAVFFLLAPFIQSRRRPNCLLRSYLLHFDSEQIFQFLGKISKFSNFKFLKNYPYDFHKILHSHSTSKGAPACAKASKSYDWNARNIAKFTSKMAKKTAIFRIFSIFSKTLHTVRTKFSTVILHHIMVLRVQGHQKHMTGIQAIQKEKESFTAYAALVSGLFIFFFYNFCFNILVVFVFCF